MMEGPAPAPEQSLANVLRDRARRASSTRLWGDIIAGLTVAVAAVWLRGPGWLALATAGLCVAAYGVWAWCDRRLAGMVYPYDEERVESWTAVRSFSALVGITAFALFLVSFIGFAIGPIIS